jgi:hypothetical protein
MAFVAVAKAAMSPAPDAAMSSKSQIELAPCWLLMIAPGIQHAAATPPMNKTADWNALERAWE